MTNMRDEIENILWDNRQNNGIDVVYIADAILDAMADMIAPLVWRLRSPDDQPFWEAKGYTIQSLPRGWEWNGRWFADPSEAQAAANTHYRAAIMVAFTGAT
jgi:hypothetical protein